MIGIGYHVATMADAAPDQQTPELSIIAPALNEEDNVGPLVEQVKRAVIDAGIRAEFIVVDDGSTDQTLPRLRELAAEHSWLRVLHRGEAKGQSAAMYAGIQAARGPVIAMLDADLQNDPADLPAMFERVKSGAADMVQGDRSAKRNEGFKRKLATGVGRWFRKTFLGDTVRDTGCTLRVIRAKYAKQYPLMFKGMHRYLPVYARLLGARIEEQPVNFRLRTAGVAKYGMWDRALVGLWDVLSVRWMTRRYRDTQVEEVSSGSGTGEAEAGS